MLFPPAPIHSGLMSRYSTVAQRGAVRGEATMPLGRATRREGTHSRSALANTGLAGRRGGTEVASRLSTWRRFPTRYSHSRQAFAEFGPRREELLSLREPQRLCDSSSRVQGGLAVETPCAAIPVPRSRWQPSWGQSKRGTDWEAGSTVPTRDRPLEEDWSPPSERSNWWGDSGARPYCGTVGSSPSIATGVICSLICGVGELLDRGGVDLRRIAIGIDACHGRVDEIAADIGDLDLVACGRKKPRVKKLSRYTRCPGSGSRHSSARAFIPR